MVLVHTRFIRLSQDKPVECRSPHGLALCNAQRKTQAGGSRFRFGTISDRILEKKRPARYEMDFDGRTGLQGMIARGWRTAPPQVDSEARLVTNSARPYPTEAVSGGAKSSLVHCACPVPGRDRGAGFGATDPGTTTWMQPARSGLTPLAAALRLSVYTASGSRILSASSFTGA
jgi:hypothetical protein